ncbi:diguanylate cyclase domain-containing protein [Caballeronia sp. LjRoot31]|jgi:predicted signal transduction protein with EAL and GGDEF domain|uniref:diguanylate cyclase domain-containing protein n=1 Tax=Caballeronia sp. LjRoot31 TaxID=3342324 RepID=UPI003ECCB790
MRRATSPRPGDQLDLFHPYPMRIDGTVIQLSASIGVLVPGPTATLSSEVLLRAADDAMYRARQAGKGRFVMHEISMPDTAPQAAASAH